MIAPAASHRRFQAFSLIELLFVMGIVSLLAALLYPVFLSIRGQARQAVCVSNLHQIGLGFDMYMQDNDGFYPYAVDPVDRAWPLAWLPYLPEFTADIPKLGMVNEVLQPYLQSPQLFRCPSDSGFSTVDYPSAPLSAAPSSYERYGTSYYYYSSLAACHDKESNLSQPAKAMILFDPVGFWHGTLTPLQNRYNILFGDSHVKNVPQKQSDKAWGIEYQFRGCANRVNIHPELDTP